MMLGEGLRLLVLVGAVFLTRTCCLENPESLATKEILRILTDRNAYDPALRPSQDGKATMVKIQMLVKRMSIDVQNMRARFDIIFRMRWNDSRLTFSQPDVNGVRIRNRHLLWIPDAYFINADVTQHESIHPDDFARVTSNGTIIFSIRLTVEENCRLKLRSFPHDTQECYISVASYGYPKDKVDFLLDEDGLKIMKSLDPRPFQLEGFGSSYRISSLSTGDFVCLDIHFKIRRDMWSCLVQLYIPAMMLVILSWFSFLLPPDQRLGRLLLSLTPQMVLVWLCFNYHKALPSVNHVRAVDVFSGVCVLVVFATLLHLLFFVFFLNGDHHLHHHQEEEDKPEVLEGESKRRVPAAKTGKQTTGRKLRLSLQKAAQPTRYIIIGIYTLFLLIYFSFYCSADGARENGV